ncbi:hypothetical protein cyc_07571 [Cyclospora cayetanensis]|uniref:UmuC domain-containing protein n=1 Tax=Cyclospora cayetanensis TaxID=88456 RepID=A0A1D3CV37_9EIME|nr:hypothetical protein cyc_07571 [Cyclospora cayetanensis]
MRKTSRHGLSLVTAVHPNTQLSEPTAFTAKSNIAASGYPESNPLPCNRTLVRLHCGVVRASPSSLSCTPSEILLLPRSSAVMLQWESVIAVNYAARACGVKRGQRVEAVKALCPSIRLVHVQTLSSRSREAPLQPNWKTDKVTLQRYRDASAEVLALLLDHCQTVEKASVDEVYADLTLHAAFLLHTLIKDNPPLSEAEDGEVPCQPAEKALQDPVLANVVELPEARNNAAETGPPHCPRDPSLPPDASPDSRPSSEGQQQQPAATPASAFCGASSVVAPTLLSHQELPLNSLQRRPPDTEDGGPHKLHGHLRLAPLGGATAPSSDPPSPTLKALWTK